MQAVALVLRAAGKQTEKKTNMQVQFHQKYKSSALLAARSSECHGSGAAEQLISTSDKARVRGTYPRPLMHLLEPFVSDSV